MQVNGRTSTGVSLKKFNEIMANPLYRAMLQSYPSITKIYHVHKNDKQNLKNKKDKNFRGLIW